jgi:hypothetical protein
MFWKWLVKLSLIIFFVRSLMYSTIMFRAYKYILKLHHVENEKNLIIYLLSLTCTSLENLKNRKNI